MSIRILTGPNELTTKNRRELKEYAEAHLLRGTRHIILDCSETGYVDSSGWNTVIVITKWFAEAGGRFELYGLNEDMMTLLQLTKLNTLISLVEVLPHAPRDAWPSLSSGSNRQPNASATIRRAFPQLHLMDLPEEAALILAYVSHQSTPPAASDIQRRCDLRPEAFRHAINELVNRELINLKEDWITIRSESFRSPIQEKFKIVESRPKLQAFLCHSSSDKPAVVEIYRKLTGEGFLPWLDTQDLLPGQDWAEEIPKAVQRCDVVLVFMSQESITKAGYVQKEIKHALDVADQQPEGTIYIITVRLEACEVPSRLRRWHWVDLFSEQGYNKLLRALREREKYLPSVYRLA
jgi:anti-anti-sigma factor